MILDYIKNKQPLLVLAPMVSNSGLAYRILSKKYGADLCFSEMVHCKHFLTTKANPIHNRWYSILPPIENFIENDYLSTNNLQTSDLNEKFCSLEEYYFDKILLKDTKYKNNFHDLEIASTFNNINDNEFKDSGKKYLQNYCKNDNKIFSLPNLTHNSKNPSFVHYPEQFSELNNYNKTYNKSQNILCFSAKKEYNEAKKYVDQTILSMKTTINQNTQLHLNNDQIYQCYEYFRHNTSPFVVQICGNDPIIMLEASKKIQPFCDAIDINFGCPQTIAKKGFYGSFLQDDLHLTQKIVETLSYSLDIPVFSKIRIFKDLSDTLNYTKMLENSGSKLISVHSRTREMKGHLTGLADLSVTKKIKQQSNIPIISNGNVRFSDDIVKNLEYTKADGIMVAESHLYNPLLYYNLNSYYNKSSNNDIYKKEKTLYHKTDNNLQKNCLIFNYNYKFPDKKVKKYINEFENIITSDCFDLALEYLYICSFIKTHNSEIKSHLFKILFHVLNEDERITLSRIFKIDEITKFIYESKNKKSKLNIDCSVKTRIRT